MVMDKVKRRGIILAMGIVIITSIYTVIYQQLLINVAEVDASLIGSLQVVIESLTTAGFGGDTGIWSESDLITGFVILMNLTGVIIVFLATPIVIVPLLEPALKVKPKKSSTIRDHVVLCGFEDVEEVLIRELEDSDIPYLIISEDSEETIELTENGYNCIFGNLNDTETYRSANIEHSRCVVINSLNEKSVNAIVTVRECSSDVKLITVSETSKEEDYHEYAGSDVVVRPRSVLADSISNKISSSVIRNIDEEIFREGSFDFKELLVKENSELAGNTIRSSGLRGKIETNIVGIWKNGVLIPSPPPSTVISSGSIFLVSGDYDDSYDGVRELSLVSKQRPVFSKVAIVGGGVVGSSINSGLEDRGYDTFLIDKKIEEADIVADITDDEAIDELSKRDFDAVILALDDDESTIYSTVGLSSQLSDTFILARCNDVQNVNKIYSAGADYVLSLSRVAQRMIFSSIDGKGSLVDTRYDVNIVEDHGFDQVSVSDENIRQMYGYTVIAVERDEEIIHDIDPDFVIQSDDRLIVVEDNLSD